MVCRDTLVDWTFPYALWCLFFFVPGFERGKEDLLPMPLKEDSHSISKSKVRSITPLSYVLGWVGRTDLVLRCVVMRPENMGISARLLSFSQSSLRLQIAYIETTHTSYTLCTSNIHQLKNQIRSFSQVSSVWRRPVSFICRGPRWICLSAQTWVCESPSESQLRRLHQTGILWNVGYDLEA